MTEKIMYKMEWRVYSRNRFHAALRGMVQRTGWKVDS